MTEIRIPKLNSNDTVYTLVEWLVPAGTPVRAGDPVATVETSKAAEELSSTADGVLHPLVAVGAECAVGAVIARLGGDGPPPEPLSAKAGAVITEPARRLMEEHGIDPAAVHALGRKVVRVADLEPFLPSAAPASLPTVASSPAALPEVALPEVALRTVALSAVQRAVGAVVAESHRTVPPAFVAVKVVLDAAIAHGRDLTRRHRRLVGVPELLIAALGALSAEHPLCYSTLVDPGTVRLAGTVGVGVTIDVGKGLHVPVIHDTGALPVEAIAERLMKLRMTALRGTFTPADLTGADILLALHTDDDVTLAVPIIPPGVTCAVSLAGRTTELFLDDAGKIATRTVVQLGLAYDHRVVNGRDAVALLRALRGRLQDPARRP